MADKMSDLPGGQIKGRIIRGIGGFYYVDTPEGLFSCKAKGIFRKEGKKPLTGDLCLISRVPESDPDPDALPVGSIDTILPRKSELIRPAVANVDRAFVVFAARDPEPNLHLLDLFLVRMEKQGVETVIGINKTDLDEDGSIRKALTERFENSGYRLCFFSAKKGEGIEEIKQLLAGKCTTMAGPSGVGKSSLINLLQPKVLMETGRVSDKTLRGKHTTRRSELIPIGDDSFIVDTPGFTSLEAGDLTKEDIAEGFPEIARWEPGCRFAGCSHIKEPDCAVREKLSEGLISLPRYESYVKMYQECSERKQYR